MNSNVNKPPNSRSRKQQLHNLMPTEERDGDDDQRSESDPEDPTNDEIPIKTRLISILKKNNALLGEKSISATAKVAMANENQHLIDELEGLVARHRGLTERLEQLERDAAAFDTPAQGVLELSRKADAARLELAEVLERLLARVKR